MTPLALPFHFEDSLPALYELMRRSVDGTVIPLFIDYTNNRVIIGATVATTSNIGKLEVTGDIKIVGSGNGLLLPSRNGNNLGRLILENADAFGNLALSVDPLA